MHACKGKSGAIGPPPGGKCCEADQTSQNPDQREGRGEAGKVKGPHGANQDRIAFEKGTDVFIGYGRKSDEPTDQDQTHKPTAQFSLPESQCDDARGNQSEHPRRRKGWRMILAFNPGGDQTAERPGFSIKRSLDTVGLKGPTLEELCKEVDIRKHGSRTG